MNIEEYNQVKDMTYLEYCDYLQSKYGLGTENYFLDGYKRNYACSRTREGLFCHHKKEDICILLNVPFFAAGCPAEWQHPENLVYCDYLEHLLLHYMIVKYPSENVMSFEDVLLNNGHAEDVEVLRDSKMCKDAMEDIFKNNKNKFNVGSGGVDLICGHLRPLVEGTRFPDKSWEWYCWCKVMDDRDVYFAIRNDFEYLRQK